MQLFWNDCWSCANISLDIQNPWTPEPVSRSFQNFCFTGRLSKSKVISLNIKRDDLFFRLFLNISSLVDIEGCKKSSHLSLLAPPSLSAAEIFGAST
jgi:hypothetical protein